MYCFDGFTGSLGLWAYGSTSPCYSLTLFEIYQFGIVSGWVGFLDTPRFTFALLLNSADAILFSLVIFCGNSFVSLLDLHFFILFAYVLFFFFTCTKEMSCIYCLEPLIVWNPNGSFVSEERLLALVLFLASHEDVLFLQLYMTSVNLIR